MKLSTRSLTILVVGVLVVGVGVYVLLETFLADRMTPARAMRAVNTQSPAVAEVLESRFPDAYRALTDRLVAAAPEADMVSTVVEVEIERTTADIVTELGPIAGRAPTTRIAVWLSGLGRTLEAVHAGAGPQVCAAFVNEGETVLDTVDVPVTVGQAIDLRDAAYLLTFADARDATDAEAPEPATEDDWNAVGQAMNGMEVPVGYAEIVANDDETAPEYCLALSYYFNTIETFPGEAGDRLRAEYFLRSFS